jgi:hypothetical protein
MTKLHVSSAAAITAFLVLVGGFSVTDWAISDTGRSNGAFGTMSWNDRAEEIAAVIMLQQFNLEVQDDFEKSIRQAIIG